MEASGGVASWAGGSGQAGAPGKRRWAAAATLAIATAALLTLCAITLPTLWGGVAKPSGSDAVQARRVATISKLSRAEASRRQWLASATARRQRLASRTAFENLGAPAAEHLLDADFGSVVSGAIANPAATVAASGRVLRYLSDYSAEVLTPRRGIEVDTATVPLQVSHDDRPKRAVDLRLRSVGPSLVPQNPLVAVSISRRLEGGVSLGSQGLRVFPEGADSTASVDADQSAFFAGVGTDEDAAVVPTITGAEFFTVLQSPRSPQEIDYRLQLPADAVLIGNKDGATVQRQGRVLAQILAPTAQDAQGVAVPVAMQVTGRELTLRVVHRSRALAYPILVDPNVTITATNSRHGWTFEHLRVEGPGPGRLTAPAGSYPPVVEGGGPAGDGEWTWNTPEDNVREVRYEGLYFTPFVPYKERGDAGTGEWTALLGGCKEENEWAMVRNQQPREGEEPLPTAVTQSKPPSCLTVRVALDGTTGEEHSVPTTFSVASILIVDRRRHHRKRRRRLAELFGTTDAADPNYAPPCEADPVNCGTGNLVESQTDLAVGGLGITLGLTRTYNSEAAVRQLEPGPFGYGWTASFSDHLLINRTEGTVTVEQANGSDAVFSGNPLLEGELRAPPWVQARLVVQGDGTYLYTLPNQTTFHFNSGGRLLTESDRDGNVTTLTYGASNRLEKITDATGRSMTVAYNAQGLVESVTDPMGHVVHYGYDSNNNLTSVTEPGESAPRWRFEYEPDHLMKEMIDGRGGVTLTHYDSQHRVSSQTDPRGITHRFEYEEIPGQVFEGSGYASEETAEEESFPETPAEEEEELWEDTTGSVPSAPELLTTITNEGTGAVTREQFNPEGELVKRTSGVGTPNKTSEELSYTEGGNVSARSDGDDHTTTYGYDREGDLETEKDPLGHTTEWHHDDMHDVTSVKTPNGELTTIKRNEHTGNAEEVSRPAPNGQTQRTNYAYGEHGELKSATEVLEHEERTWSYGYDQYGDRTSETDPKGDKRSFAYNEDSQLVSTTAPRGNVAKGPALTYTTTIERDQQGRPTAVLEPPEGFSVHSSLPGTFGSASAVAVNSEGDVWVGRLSSGAVEEFSKSGQFIRKLPSTFESPCKGSLAETAGLAVDSSNDLYVTDRKGDRVLKFSPEGKCLLEFGSEGEGNGQFKEPQGIAVSTSGHVFVLDSCNGRVEQFSETGEFIGAFHVASCAANPWGLAVDSKGHVWVSAMLSYEAASEYTESGEFLRSVSSPNEGEGYSWASGLTAAPGGGVFVTYWQEARVERYGPEGEYLERFGSCCSGEGHFQWATGLALAPDGSLWLSEESSKRVEHWEPFAATTKYTYDPDGNLKTLTNPDGRTTEYEYDEDDELTKVTEPNRATEETEYDDAGQVTAEIDGNHHKTQYKRNVLEQVEEVIDPLSRATKQSYDHAGNVRTVTNPEGKTTCYQYNADNLVTKVSYSEEPISNPEEYECKTPDGEHPVEYKYNADADREELVDATGTTKYTYDELDRLTKAEHIRTSPAPKEVTQYGYDLANELTRLVYPNGKEVKRAYDSAGRLASVTDWLNNETKFNYNEDSALTSTVFPASSGEEDRYFTDALDEVVGVSFYKGEETLASISYSRDSEGNLTSAVTSKLPEEGSTSYTYDENGRLKSAGSSTGYEYDNANNLKKIGSTTLTPDEADELKEAGATKYEYNKEGERTEAKPSSGPGTRYNYNQAEELTNVNRPLEHSTPEIKDAYSYDGEGLRSSQEVSGATTYMAWSEDGGLPLLLSDGSNSYVYGPGDLPIEQVSSSTGKVEYLHHDQAGSTRLVTGETGLVEGAYSYSPYGEVTGHTGGAMTPLLYDGQYTNSDTGLQYLRARSYDPSTGQFLSVDPLAALSTEPYSYAGDNPVSEEDPTGRCASFRGPDYDKCKELQEEITKARDEVAKRWQDQREDKLKLPRYGPKGTVESHEKKLEEWQERLRRLLGQWDLYSCEGEFGLSLPEDAWEWASAPTPEVLRESREYPNGKICVPFVGCLQPAPVS